jgi:serine/threonine-protein kinase
VSDPFAKRVRDYEVWGRLGEGGMSEVWLAKHTVLAIPVIIKTMRAHAQEPESSPMGKTTAAWGERIIQEARMMAKVTSPRVVRAIDAGVHDGRAYLVQEYVDGIDLAELDRRRRAALGVGLPLWFVCLLMRETCAALHAAHQAGVIHRDVKPSNIFDSPGTGVRLGDFGIAVVNAGRSTGDVGGTVMYSAPEQLRGDAVGRFTDVFGAGATAYDLRYGRPPFSSLDAILDPGAEPSFPPPATPTEAYFQHVLRRMLVKDVARRNEDPSEPRRAFGTLFRALRPGSWRPPTVILDKNAFRLGDCTVSFSVGDIAHEAADAIVSSGNYTMMMRTGVSDALRVRGGDCIEEEARSLGEQPLGACIATKAGSLRAKSVLHAVSAWNETSCVGRAMARALLLSDELGHHSLAFPALGTGAAKVSLEMCASAMMGALEWHVALGGTRLHTMKIILGDDQKLRLFREVALEAVESDDAPLGLDLGLPVEGGEVHPEAATYLDAAARPPTGPGRG